MCSKIDCQYQGLIDCSTEHYSGIEVDMAGCCNSVDVTDSRRDVAEMI